MRAVGRCCAALAVVAAALGPMHASGAAGSLAGQTLRPHAGFDETARALASALRPGARATPLTHPRVPLSSFHASAPAPAGARAGAAATTPRDPEILGFAQAGEVASGAWTSDLRFNLLTTVAYFGVNVNSNGTLVTNDSDYATWRSSQVTSLMNAAHSAGDRVVLTVKSFSDATIGGATGSETARQTLIASILNELRTRGGDGVNVDFEGVSSGLATNYVTFVSELDSALKSQVPTQSYLSIDTYASAALGGSMYDLPALAAHVDAVDLMGYGFESGGTASPSAPLRGDWYNVTAAVNDYQARGGVPASELILGVPYYGYKWSVASGNPGNDGEQPGTGATADTYAAALADMGCAEQLTQFWDSTFDEPYATWWSPASGDPCGGNHNSWRELYYDNAQSLGDKYDLVNAEGLRGIGIWALGYDSGSSDLWNEIALKFSVSHAPTATVNPLPASESTTEYTVSWAPTPGSPPAAYYILWARDGSGPWDEYTTTAGTSTAMFGFPGHSYAYYVQAVAANGYNSGGPSQPQASTAVSSGATRSVTAFTSMYAARADGVLESESSPPAGIGSSFGWNIARGVSTDPSGMGGVELDGWGGLHAFGDTTSASGSVYWPGWDIARGIAATPQGRGYVLDGFGGLHPFTSNGAAPPPAATASAYWQGWDIARAVAVFADGSGGVVLDGFGGVHPFTVAGDSQLAAAPRVSAYWPGWDIARAVVLLPGSTVAHDAGYVLDAYGALHPFGGAPAVTVSAYWPHWDVARGLALLPGSSTAGYVIDAYGGAHPFGGAPAVVSPLYASGAGARGVALH